VVIDLTLTDLEAELARRDFATFVALAHPEWVLEWYHHDLIAQVQAWADSPRPYHLILTLPPGHGKSAYARLAASWLAWRDPSTRLVYASYGATLAEEHLGEVEMILDSDLVRDACGRILDGGEQTKGHKTTACGGWLRAVGRGGALTGYRVDVGVADDLLKDDMEASSATIRERTWRWLTRVLMTRKRPGRPLRLLLLNTRWHLDDHIGRLMAQQPDRCREVRYEALREDMGDARDPRPAGEALWPALMSRQELEEQRAIDAQGFACLYQGRPTPRGGRTFALDTLRHWDDLPCRPQDATWYQSWDLRGGGASDAGSWAVGLLACVPHDEPGHVYLVALVRGRWDFDETLKRYRELQSEPLWEQARIRWVEDKADGRQLIPRVQASYPAIPVQPQGDKWLRARAVAPHLVAGQVHVPKRAAWWETFAGELADFPGAPSDDQVDALTQLLDRLWGVERAQRQAQVHARARSRVQMLADY